jgi:hypothetical protein
MLYDPSAKDVLFADGKPPKDDVHELLAWARQQLGFNGTRSWRLLAAQKKFGKTLFEIEESTPSGTRRLIGKRGKTERADTLHAALQSLWGAGSGRLLGSRLQNRWHASRNAASSFRRRHQDGRHWTPSCTTRNRRNPRPEIVPNGWPPASSARLAATAGTERPTAVMPVGEGTVRSAAGSRIAHRKDRGRCPAGTRGAGGRNGSVPRRFPRDEYLHCRPRTHHRHRSRQVFATGAGNRRRLLPFTDRIVRVFPDGQF